MSPFAPSASSFLIKVVLIKKIIIMGIGWRGTQKTGNRIKLIDKLFNGIGKIGLIIGIGLGPHNLDLPYLQPCPMKRFM